MSDVGADASIAIALQSRDLLVLPNVRTALLDSVNDLLYILPSSNLWRMRDLRSRHADDDAHHHGSVRERELVLAVAERVNRGQCMSSLDGLSGNVKQDLPKNTAVDRWTDVVRTLRLSSVCPFEELQCAMLFEETRHPLPVLGEGVP